MEVGKVFKCEIDLLQDSIADGNCCVASKQVVIHFFKT